MKKLKNALARYVPDLILVAGATAVAVGAGLIYAPAGLIVGGLLAMVGAILSCVDDGGDSK